ncbi:MAG: hypothetical protein ACFB2X_01455 [Rivularia sp. (in: cyanobacteria)]
MLCATKNSATVIYQFAGDEKKRFFVEKEDLPIEVVKEKVKKSSNTLSGFRESFPGAEKGSYSFVIEAPAEIPEDTEIEIYLIEGIWDDYGGIGTYVTDPGIVKRYEGDPLLIGTGRSVSGTVTNLEPVECYAIGTIEWRYLDGCKLKIFNHQGKVLYEEEGDCPLTFEVTCDDDCPSGHIKCNSNKYPGYCCVNCKDFTSKIRSLGSKLK